MFEYRRLEGYCPLCYRMTHAVTTCYKLKFESRKVGLDRKRNLGHAERNKSFKGAVLGGKRNSGNLSKAMMTIGNSVGEKMGRGASVSSLNLVAREKEIETVVANLSLSAKKVHRPLFQENVDETLDDDVGITMVSDQVEGSGSEKMEINEELTRSTTMQSDVKQNVESTGTLQAVSSSLE